MSAPFNSIQAAPVASALAFDDRREYTPVSGIGIGDSTTLFGPYTAHPVANLFPLMRDSDPDGFAALIDDIRKDGLIDPIVLDGNTLLDGRNRYLACIEAKVQPHLIQFKDLGLSIAPHHYAFQRNQSRRSLTPEQRATIAAAFFRFNEEEVRRQQALAGKEGGKQGGRGHKKTPVPELIQGFSKSKRKPRTVDKVAEAAGVSTHKAQQAINVVQRGSAEQVQAVITGKAKLKDVARKPAPVVTDAGARLGLVLEGSAPPKKGKVPGNATPGRVVVTLHRLVTLLTRLDPVVTAQAVPLVDANRVQCVLVEFKAWAESFARHLNTGPAELSEAGNTSCQAGD